MAGAMKFKRGDALRFAGPAIVAVGAKPVVKRYAATQKKGRRVRPASEPYAVR